MINLSGLLMMRLIVIFYIDLECLSTAVIIFTLYLMIILSGLLMVRLIIIFYIDLGVFRHSQYNFYSGSHIHFLMDAL
jgi:hypothetical protein